MKNNNEEYYLNAIKNSAKLLKNVPKDLRNNKDFLIKATEVIEKDWFYLFATIDPEIINDKELILKIVAKNPMSLMYIPELMKEDTEIALTALKANKDVFYCIGFNLKEELSDKKSIDDKINHLEKIVLNKKLSENLVIQQITVKRAKL